MDNPNHRSSHIHATPRGGGIAFVLVGTLFNFLYETGPSRWIPVACLPLACVGLVDDFRELPATLRYVVQLVTAIVLVGIVDRSMPLWLSLVSVLLITAIINFTNFMDGLDGLVAGCGVLLMASTSSWAISGAIFGFLIWNWAPAKVFMGDVGSTYIGALFGGMLIHRSPDHDMFSILLIGFPLLADAFICVIRRFVSGENIFKAHRKHLFQRLQQAGWSHQKVATFYISAVAVLLLSYTIAGFTVLIISVLTEFFIAFYLERYVAAKF
jgi:UDP-N-acetylmuramyl pentapeptide phosphotransferase/UDP-N-acetylglucosamine-1-phosphate transferase